MQFEADFYDGISPRAKRVLVTIHETHFRFTVPITDDPEFIGTQELEIPIDDCHIQAKLGSGKRLIDLPDDSRLETDFQLLEQYLPRKASSIFWRGVHYAETHKFLIAIAFIGIMLASILLLQYGVPVMAKYAAMATPSSIEEDLGRQTLSTLDNTQLGYFRPSEITAKDQQAVQDALATLCKKTADCPPYHLNFRKSPEIGPNAFALPGGQLIITDELIALGNNENEITAVLAHELGHVKQRHALQQALQVTISGLIIIAVTGDVSSIAAGLPALMINMRYSRDLETDADRYALQSLRTACIPTKSFATILFRLEMNYGEIAVPELISSHPDTKARVIPFLQDRSYCT